MILLCNHRAVSPARKFGLAASLLLAAVAAAPRAGAAPAVSTLVKTTPGGHKVASYDVIHLGRGHLNRLQLAVTIDGVRGLMILDSGAESSLLGAGKYKFLLNNSVKRPANIPAVANVNGMAAKVGTAASLTVGSLQVANVSFPVVADHLLYQDNRLFEFMGSQQYDGLLGEDVLRHSHAVIDCHQLMLYLNTDPNRKIGLGENGRP